MTTKMNDGRKYHFYTRPNLDGNWVGRCKELPDVFYSCRGRDGALSGVKRLVKKMEREASFGALASVPPANKKKVNRVAFVVDRSGSMSSLTAASMAALRKNIAQLIEESRRTGQKTLATVVAFNEVARVVVDPTDVDKGDVRLPDSAFYASGMTALFDATGQAIERLQGLPVGPDEDVAYLVVTITDGEENSSQRFNASSLKNLMKHVQGTDRWTLSFLLPPGHKRNFCATFGIPEGNVMEWEATEQGVERHSGATMSAITSYYTGRTLGNTSTKTFYTDLSAVDPAAVRAKLRDIRGEVSVWTVKKEEKVRDFCEKQSGKPFLKGAAFYALTKAEKKVQPYKKLLIVEKGKDAVYAGDDARSLLGFPPNETVKVVPGNHAGFDIYVQSTSTNRFLVRGTKVVYAPSLGVAFKEGPSSSSGKKGKSRR